MSVVDQIHQKHSLIDWMKGDIDRLKKIGGGYMGKAPWRAERSASVAGYEKTQLFFDFGDRSKRGDVIDWVAFTRGMSNDEAIRFLSDDRPVPAPKARICVAVEGEKTPSVLTMDMVNAYHNHLSAALPYFESRGIHPDIARQAKLGYRADHPIYQKVTWKDGSSEWLGRPFMTIPIFTIPNFVGFDRHRQEVRAIHYRYDTDTARQKIRDMFRLGSQTADKLARWLGADDKENAVFEWCFGSRYSNIKGGQSKLFNANRLRTLDPEYVAAPLSHIVVCEGPLPAYVVESGGFYAVGLPHSEKNIDAKVAFANIIGKIFVATDDDNAGEKRYEWIKRECGEHRVVRVPMNGQQADEMILNGRLQAFMAKWGVEPVPLDIMTASPWI